MAQDFNRKGFSLLEVMISLVFLAVSGVALLQVLGLGVKMSSQNDQRLTAVLLAQEVLEDMRDESSYDDLDNFNSVRQTLTGNFSGFDRAVSVGADDPKQVDVTVYWTAFSEEQSIQLSSLFAEYDY